MIYLKMILLEHLTKMSEEKFTFWWGGISLNKTDFMCCPQLPIQSLGSFIILKPEFTAVFLTTTGVMVLSFHFK